MLWNYQPLLLDLRFVVSFLILLVPTTAMGLTLPVLIDDPLLGQTDFRRAIGFLYGSNTLGAMAGAVLGEACLIRVFGLYGTSLAAASAVCIAAAIAILVANYGPRGQVRVCYEKDPSRRAFETDDMSQQSKFPLRFDVAYRPPWRLLFVSFGTGLIFLALEVIWFRFLRLYVASSPTVFAIMLAVVLAGIGAGGLLAGMIYRLFARPNLLPILLLVAAILVLLSYVFFPGELIAAPAGVFDVRWWRIAILSVALMLPVALVSGILFPSIAAEVQASVGNRMNSTGISALFNTTGAAIGPMVASFVLLPALGYQRSLICCAAGYALLSIVVTRRANLVVAPAIGDHHSCGLGCARRRLRIFPVRARGGAFPTRKPSIRKRRSGPRARTCGKADGGNIRHVAVAAARPVWGAVLLPVADRCVLDVGYKSAQPTVHAIICLSAAGLSSRGERCAASLLRMRRYGGCVHS